MKNNYLQNAKRFVRNSLSCFSFFLLLFTTMQTYAQNPQCQWAEKIAGTARDNAYSTSTDESGNVYVAGAFDSPTLTFNNGIILANSGVDDGYLAKYNSDGVCQWAEKIAGTSYDYAVSTRTDESGNVYVAGIFGSPTLIFNNGIILANSGDLDGYIAKYNSSGVCQWAEKIAGTNYDYVNSISIDESGNVYVAGDFASTTITFNNGIILANSGDLDGYIAKYNSSGVCQWAEKIAGSYNDYAYSISTDVGGNVYVSGRFWSPTLTFNNGIILANSGDLDGYIAKYNSSGVCQWAEKIAGTGYDYARSISTDVDGNM
ncbi:MAG: hypothetical protein GX121_09080 [Ignavibacteria bacterium]|nr:hypothetical protein [Ignavibacteria bacterium]